MGNSPLMTMALFAAYEAFNGAFEALFLIIVQTPTSIAGGCEQFRSVSASAPFVATLVDVTGLVIYFTVASMILRGTLL
jgi:hypothetical protein